MAGVRERKKALRRIGVEMFSLLPRDVRRELDAALAERVREYVFETGAKFLLGYAPMTDEPDVSPFFRRWVAEGGRLAMPVWLGGESMRMREVRDLDGELHPGRCGILEPSGMCPEADEAEVDLVITPGRFFSEDCGRMGRGSGCYDALFRRRNPAKIGVAYDFQILPAIPTYGGDVPVDLVITPTRIVSAGRKNIL